MNKKDYIANVFRKILKEDLEEKAESLMNKLNYDKTLKLNKDKEFDYVQEGSQGMCEQCGGVMTESECSECGWKGTGEVMELGGMDDGHPKFGNVKFKNKMTDDEIERLLRGDDEDEDEDYEEFDFKDYDDDDDYEDLDIETDWTELEEDQDGFYYDPSDFDPHTMMHRSDMEAMDNEFRKRNENPQPEKNRPREKTSSMSPESEKMDNDWGALAAVMGVDPREAQRLADMMGGETNEEQLYEVEFEKEMEEEETSEGNAFTGALADAKKKGKGEFEVDGKKYDVKEASKPDFLDLDDDGDKEESMKSAAKNKKMKGKGKVKVSESILFTENDLIDLIERIVKEEKNSFSMKEPKGYREYQKAHNKDKKENEDYLKSVAKKMTDYLKDSSDNFSKYEMKETQKFPTENGGMKAKRKKYTPSDAVDEYIEAFSYPGQTNLVYDEIKPNDKKIEGQIKGSSTNGNAQVDKDGKALGNVVPSEVGERFYKNFKDNLYGQEQMNASYKRQPQPVDQAGEDTERGTLKSKKGKKTSQSVLNKLEESKNIKKENQLNEEFDRIQQLMGYNRKTQ